MGGDCVRRPPALASSGLAERAVDVADVVAVGVSGARCVLGARGVLLVRGVLALLESAASAERNGIGIGAILGIGAGIAADGVGRAVVGVGGGCPRDVIIGGESSAAESPSSM